MSRILPLLCLAGLCSFCQPYAQAAAFRDPFWQIGWQPPKTKVETSAEEAKPPSESAQTAPVPAPKVSDVAPLALWIEARKQVNISGTSRARGADGNFHQVLYGKGYTQGDVISVSHKGYQFTWRLRETADRELHFKPLKSIRIIAADETTPNNQKDTP